MLIGVLSSLSLLPESFHISSFCDQSKIMDAIAAFFVAHSLQYVLGGQIILNKI